MRYLSWMAAGLGAVGIMASSPSASQMILYPQDLAQLARCDTAIQTADTVKEKGLSVAEIADRAGRMYRITLQAKPVNDDCPVYKPDAGDTLTVEEIAGGQIVRRYVDRGVDGLDQAFANRGGGLVEIVDVSGIQSSLYRSMIVNIGLDHRRSALR